MRYNWDEISGEWATGGEAATDSTWELVREEGAVRHYESDRGHVALSVEAGDNRQAILVAVTYCKRHGLEETAEMLLDEIEGE